MITLAATGSAHRRQDRPDRWRQPAAWLADSYTTPLDVTRESGISNRRDVPPSRRQLADVDSSCSQGYKGQSDPDLDQIGDVVTRIMRVLLNEQTDEFIEVEIDGSDFAAPVELASKPGQALIAPFNLDTAAGRIGLVAKTLISKLRAQQMIPDELELQMSLKIGGETGLVFAKGTTEATFIVTARWHQAEKPRFFAD
ncbi:CU044_2847 family protein [Catellatospora citrea]|uniref:CU044_2847 family protein n=1 Tax=Catellatospora citrea TaxID=53366 RepID=UPI0033CCB4EA